MSNLAYKRVSVGLRPDQYQRLRSLALDCAQVRGGSPDASALVRGILDLYFARFPKPLDTRAKRS